MGDLIDASDKDRRKAAAQSLQRQIDDLVAGRVPPKPPSSLRDFVAQKMAEDRQNPTKDEESGGS